MRRTARLFAVPLAVLASAGAPLYAHHSFAAYYHEAQSTTIEGLVVEFQYKAPHAWVFLDVKETNGQTQRYSAEWANPTRLERQGVGRDVLQYGDRVSITGSPGREASDRKIHLKAIERFTRGAWSWQQRQRR